MILYKCDLCKKEMSESDRKGLFITTNMGISRDSFDICTDCAKKIYAIAEGKINEDVWTNIYNPVCDSSDDVYRGQE